MHVDWRWIKQRPHFLAEGLSQYYKIDVWHERTYGYGKNQLVDNSDQLLPNLSIHCIKRLPFSRFKIIYFFNILINKIVLMYFYKKADIVWVPSPLYYLFFNLNKHQTLIYDCMDDMLEFNHSISIKNRIKKYEKLLYEKADIIIASSEHLRLKLLDRYKIKKNIEVINNAIFLPSEEKIEQLPNFLRNLFKDKLRKKIVYIGTISKWFDFNLILQSLEQNYMIEYFLFGPSEIDIPLHPRINVLGAVEHKYVLSIMQYADCLIMPFIVNELIKSVNPVKAYEYIYSCKPSILPLYGETIKFKDYVYLYSSSEEYFKIIEQLTLGLLTIQMLPSEHQSFVMQNTWKNRIDQLLLLTNKYVSSL